MLARRRGTARRRSVVAHPGWLGRTLPGQPAEAPALPSWELPGQWAALRGWLNPLTGKCWQSLCWINATALRGWRMPTRSPLSCSSLVPSRAMLKVAFVARPSGLLQDGQPRDSSRGQGPPAALGLLRYWWRRWPWMSNAMAG